MKIGEYLLGYGQLTFIIAEGCSNIVRHLDDMDGLIQLVASTGASSLKIQLFKAEIFPLAEQSSKRLVEFPRDKVKEFVNLCHKHNLAAGASVFDADAVNLLEQSGADFIKMATREWENLTLWQHVMESHLPIVASWDYTQDISLPYTENTIHLACVPKYPVIDPHVPNDFDDSEWGWSSHTADWLDVLIAVSRGACAVEKHVKFSETDFEAGWSLSVYEFGKMVNDIRQVERMR